MDYKLKDPSIASELHPGDRITAKVLADKDGDGYTNVQLDDIVVIAQARPTTNPPSRTTSPRRATPSPTSISSTRATAPSTSTSSKARSSSSPSSTPAARSPTTAHA